MALPYEFFIAIRYLKAKRKQTFVSLITFISIAGVAVGVMSLTISLALMTGFEQDIRGRILSGSAHLTAFPARQGETFENVGDLLARTQRIEGVAAVSAVISGFGVLTNEYATVFRPITISGIDPEQESRVVPIAAQMIEGDARAVAEAPEGDRPPILLGKDLAGNLGVRAGDLVQLFATRQTLTPFGAIPRPTWLRVAGVFDAGYYEYNLARAYVPRATAARIYQVHDANQIEVRVKSLGELDDVEEQVRETIGGSCIVVNLVRQNGGLLSALRWEKLLMFIVISLIVLVAALNIVSTLILMVMEKVRDIGTLVAMGATSRGVLLLFMIQGLVIGVVGTFLGLFGGIAASLVCDRYRLIRLDPDVYFTPYVPFQVRPLDSLVVALIAVAISFLATIYPAWRASRLDPVEALQHV